MATKMLVLLAALMLADVALAAPPSLDELEDLSVELWTRGRRCSDWLCNMVCHLVRLPGGNCSEERHCECQQPATTTELSTEGVTPPYPQGTTQTPDDTTYDYYTKTSPHTDLIETKVLV